MDNLRVGVHVITVCPDLKLRNTLIRAIQVVAGIKPVLKSGSESAERAHYAPAVSKLIINTAVSRMHELLGPHSVVLALEVAGDRVAAAHTAAGVFLEANV